MIHRTIVFCVRCGHNIVFKLKDEDIELEHRAIRFSVKEVVAICSECGKEVYVPEINDANVAAREIAYRQVIER